MYFNNDSLFFSAISFNPILLVLQEEILLTKLIDNEDCDDSIDEISLQR